MGMRIYQLLYAGVWLVFLAIPTTAAVTADVPVALRVLAVVATLCFAVLYLETFWHLPEQDSAHARRWAVGRVAALAALAAVTVPASGYMAVTFSCFLAAILVFALPVRIGLISGVCVWTAAAAGTLPFVDTFWPLLGTGIGVLFIVVIRLAEDVEHRQRDAEHELRHAAQRDAIARDVHDVLGHSLTVLFIRAQLAGRLIDRDPQQAREEIDRIDALARESLAQVRSTVARLRTPQLASEVDTAREALAAAGITADLDVHTVDDADAELFAWALREAVTNVVRHSGASTCRVRIRPGMLVVSDDGVGMDGQSGGTGFGLRGLRERATASGARLSIVPRCSDAERPGTVVEVERT